MESEITPNAPTEPILSESSALLALAEKLGDHKEYLYSSELLLLRKIAETSGDLVKARQWEEFREINGGMEGFENAHCAAVGAWEQWHRDGEG